MFISVRSILFIALLSGLMITPAFAATAPGPGAFPGAKGQPFQALQAQITDLGQRLSQESLALRALIANLQSQINSNGSDILDLKARCTLLDDLLAALRAELLVVKQQVAMNSADIAALKAQDLLHAELFAALEAKIAALDLRITSNEGDIAALILRDQTLQQLIFALQNQVTTLESRVQNNSSDISTLQSQIIDLQSRMALAESQIVAKQARISQACSPGSSIRQIFADGSVSCEVDDIASGVGTLVVTNEGNGVSDGASTAFVGFDVLATCPSTYRLTGGGYAVSNDLTFVFRNYAYGSSWLVTARGTWPVTTTAYAFANCARVQ